MRYPKLLFLYQFSPVAMPKKKLKSGDAGEATPAPTFKRKRVREISFSDFNYSDENVEVPVQATELTKLYKAMATANGHAYSDLMVNDEIQPNIQLECRTIETLPHGFRFLKRRADGYIQPKIRGSSTADGHSFWSDGTSSESDPSFVQPRARISTTGSPGSPRRAKSRAAAPSSMTEPPLTPDSLEGCHRVMPILLHRAAALATSDQPERDCKKYGVLHICGRKNCGVVSHFRPGSRRDNELDEEHHRTRPGTSRTHHHSWQ